MFIRKQKRRSIIAADTTRKGIPNDIDDSVLSVRHRHTGSAFYGFPRETQYRMAGVGACGRCLPGSNLPLILILSPYLISDAHIEIHPPGMVFLCAMQ